MDLDGEVGVRPYSQQERGQNGRTLLMPYATFGAYRIDDDDDDDDEEIKKKIPVKAYFLE